MYFFYSVELYFKEIFETYWGNTSTLKKQMNGNGSLHTYMDSCYLFYSSVLGSKSEIHQHWQHPTVASQEINISDHKRSEAALIFALNSCSELFLWEQISQNSFLC